MPSNETRAERAQIAVQLYVEAKGDVFENSSSEIADLIADLLHHTVIIDDGDDAVESTLRLARLHFDAEHDNPEEQDEPDSAFRSKSEGNQPRARIPKPEP